MKQATEAANQLDLHLRAPRQIWLLGAGASFEAGLPLMPHLTNRILKLVKDTLLESLKDSLKEDANIEDILNHIRDLISISMRTQNDNGDKIIRHNGIEFEIEMLEDIRKKILKEIQHTLKWGYIQKVKKNGRIIKNEVIGKQGKPITSICKHRNFVNALFKINRAGLENQLSAIQLVTTNYDTLLEDALALEKIPYTDGLVGGAIASWDEQNYKQSVQFSKESKDLVALTKLHGSIDWYRDTNDGQIFRIRTEDQYPKRNEAGSVVIYPEASKFELVHRLPFSALFQNFRQILSGNQDQVLFTCGYSFGDEHVNSIIEDRLFDPNSKLTLVVLTEKRQSNIKHWTENKDVGERIFTLADSALYRGDEGPFFVRELKDKKWWTFSGAIDLLQYGLPREIEMGLYNDRV